MSSGTAKDFEDYARDCVRLAEHMNSPELAKEGLPSLKRPTSPRHHVFQDR